MIQSGDPILEAMAFVAKWAFIAMAWYAATKLIDARRVDAWLKRRQDRRRGK